MGVGDGAKCVCANKYDSGHGLTARLGWCTVMRSSGGGSTAPCNIVCVVARPSPANVVIMVFEVTCAVAAVYMQ